MGEKSPVNYPHFIFFIMSRRRKQDKLESKVSRIITHKDEEGIYIPYCGLKFHPGIIVRENVCIKRQCKHYCKLYIKDSIKPYNLKI